MALAEVRFSTGRCFLSVAGIIVAMEGDKCRDIFPEEACEPIPQEELERACIGDKRASEVPLHVVRFFRGDNWCQKSLKWAAERINGVVEKKAEPYN
jgi:hypothetical protein